MLKPFYKILSIALLLLFVTNLFHDVVPHVHHQHDNIFTSESHTTDHHHDGDDHHHHSDKSNKEGNGYSFFDFLFANHSHSEHVHQLVPKIVEHTKQIKQLESKTFFKSTIPSFNFRLIRDAEHRRYYGDEFFPDAPLIYSNFLRGPPFLG